MLHQHLTGLRFKYIMTTLKKVIVIISILGIIILFKVSELLYGVYVLNDKIMFFNEENIINIEIEDIYSPDTSRIIITDKETIKKIVTCMQQLKYDGIKKRQMFILYDCSYAYRIKVFTLKEGYSGTFIDISYNDEWAEFDGGTLNFPFCYSKVIRVKNSSKLYNIVHSLLKKYNDQPPAAAIM